MQMPDYALPAALVVCVLTAGAAVAGEPERGRSLGIPFEGTPGPLNAITDVPGVEVGQVSIVRGDGLLKVGEGPVRTGVTVILPRGKGSVKEVYAGSFNLNGNGEMTGQAYIQDFGFAFGPVGISNTNAVGQVYSGIMQWTQREFGNAIWPVVSETWDGRLNDIEGFHVRPEDAIAAIEAAKAGPVEEGNVGGGTGMVCFGFKGGIGTASRVFEVAGKTYTVGVLTQCNTGIRNVLRIAGAPVGQELAEKWLSCYEADKSPADKLPKCSDDGNGGKGTGDSGSIAIIVATDAPLIPNTLNRVARRAALGLGRLGSFASSYSGDLVLAFSTTDAVNTLEAEEPVTIEQFPNGHINEVFQATVEATEEAIVNAMVAARTMTGADGWRFYAIPHDELKAILGKYGRLSR
jgi:L-aminopeptidase/D-esterase-like protein